MCQIRLVPIPKNKAEDFCSLNNYLRLTRSPIISNCLNWFCMICIACLIWRQMTYNFCLRRRLDVQAEHLFCGKQLIISMKVIVIYIYIYIASLDVSKAFDRVNHFKLFLKVDFKENSYCIMDIIVNLYSKLSVWIESIGHVSDILHVISGVRLGGVL